MANTAINTQQIQNALDELRGVLHTLTTARDDALGAATALLHSWQSTNAAPNFQKSLSDIIGSEDTSHSTVNIALLISDTQSMINYLEAGIADHTQADIKLAQHG